MVVSIARSLRIVCRTLRLTHVPRSLLSGSAGERMHSGLVLDWTLTCQKISRPTVVADVYRPPRASSFKGAWDPSRSTLARDATAGRARRVPRARALHATYGSPNLVERWFAELTTKQLRHGAHRSVAELERAIQEFLMRITTPRSGWCGRSALTTSSRASDDPPNARPRRMAVLTSTANHGYRTLARVRDVQRCRVARCPSELWGRRV